MAQHEQLLKIWVDEKFAHRHEAARAFILKQIISKHHSQGVAKGVIDILMEDLAEQINAEIASQGH